MNGFLSKFLTEQVAAKIVDEGVGGCKEVICTFANNYAKRRNVGFTIIESANGSFQDTKNYYADILTGKDPREMHQAIEYNK